MAANPKSRRDISIGAVGPCVPTEREALYRSQLAMGLVPSVVPPQSNTLSVGTKIAAWPLRALRSDAVDVNDWLVGS